jgi:hypothetical protein
MTICNDANCNRTAGYNYPTTKAKYGSFHKMEGMVDVITK